MRIPRINNYRGIKVAREVNTEGLEFSKPVYIFYNEKSRNKFIKRIEKIVRSSLEYREFINYLRESLGMNFCTFFNNVSKSKGKKIGIEIHHMPFSLYDITSIVLKKYETEELPIDPYVIAEEVIKLHYTGKVGLIPLSTTVHELYHRGDLFIPLQIVDKGYLLFYKEYKEYMEEYNDILATLIKLSKQYDASQGTPLLEKNLVKVNNGYNSTPNTIY